MNLSPTEYRVETLSGTSSNVGWMLLAASLELASHPKTPRAVPPAVTLSARPSTIGQFGNIFATVYHQPQTLDLEGAVATTYSTLVANKEPLRKEFVYNLSSISADLPWLATLQLRNRVRSTSDELISAINGLNILLKDRDFDLIDKIFQGLNVTEISPEMMLAFIRTTFAARSKLGEWFHLRDRVRAELSSRRFDPDTLLKGLG
jgi:hypothetical protein